MKIVIFAGGTGRRLWPISRKKSPKQFEPILGEKSTLQLAIDRVVGPYGAENIYVSSNERYQEMIRQQLPALPEQNVIGEPVRRDLAAAVGLALTHLSQTASPDEPIAILWGDNYMSEVATFQRLLAKAEQLVSSNQAEIVYMGETPRFANNNLGWIGLGEQKDTGGETPCFGLNSFTYRPPLAECEAMFASGRYVWNTGYFVTSVGYIQGLYEQHQPNLASQLAEIGRAIGTEAYDTVLHEVYPQLDVMSFDDAILVHMPYEQVLVLHDEMGWSDPGTLYALKEALNPGRGANAEKGQVIAHESTDCLLYNYESDKLLTVVGMEGMIVVNTEDAILVVHKDNVPLVKKMVDNLEGTEWEKYS